MQFRQLVEPLEMLSVVFEQWRHVPSSLYSNDKIFVEASRRKQRDALVRLAEQLLTLVCVVEMAVLIELEGLAGTSYRLENMLTLSSLLVKQSWNKLFLQSRTRYLFFLFGYSVKELFLLSLAQQSAAMVRLHAPSMLA